MMRIARPPLLSLLLPCTLTLTLTLTACGDDAMGGGLFDFSFPPRDLSGAVTDDLASPENPDGGGATTKDLSVRDLSTPSTMPDFLPPPVDLAPKLCGVVVNEVQIGSAVGIADEMVEIFNSCAQAITLPANSVLIARASGDPTIVELQDLSGLPLPAGAYRLYTNTSYAGVGASDGVFPIAGADTLQTNGAVALAIRRGAAYDLIDAVAWGSGVGGALQEGPTRPASPANGKTVARIPNGDDTDVNGDDFVSTATPTPRAVNQP